MVFGLNFNLFTIHQSPFTKKTLTFKKKQEAIGNGKDKKKHFENVSKVELIFKCCINLNMKKLTPKLKGGINGRNSL